MLQTMQSIRGYRLLADDGRIGRVDDFYFDDDEWVVRYLVADTGRWLPGRLVLISPQSIGLPDWDSHQLPVSLSMAQIEDSPSIRNDRPVSRRLETELHGHFGWMPYWAADPPATFRLRADPSEALAAAPMAAAAVTAAGDPHLRSMHEVTHYHIRATDDEIGHVEDFVLDCDDWTVRYMIVDTRNWLPGRKVLIPPAWIRSVDWGDASVEVDLTRDQVQGAPEFDPSAPVNRAYEARLYDYYGRPHYW